MTGTASPTGLMGIYPHDGRDVTLPFHEVMKQGDDALKKNL